MAMTANNISAKVMAMKTPIAPSLNVMAAKYANGNWNIQNAMKLIFVGVFVSPDPLKACVTTIP